MPYEFKALSIAILFVVYVLTSSVGLYLLKASPAILCSTFVLGGALYALGAILWLFILRIVPISIAFPAASGSLIIASVAIGYFILNEKIGMVQLIGCISIISGIFMITFKAE